ncbi:GntP family permease [Streptomyces anulatus]|uniref:GntP family permease n=1 Tax=Streptomyces anulatus TaxID=1892 RepID=UPI00225A91A1|nr:GntP family permease [Streptomyces anulatus]MCX4522117.1 GntP family permease [Streptomyces anulatus]MCX4604994.1 GntP family permease [Streptomyces anulatus]
MSTAGPSLLVALAISIVLIIVLCGRFRLHPFLAIVIATYGFGLAAMGIGAATGADKPFVDDLGATIAEGFGSILASIGLVILFGTIIGKVLERTGAAVTLAEAVLKVVGKRHPALAMSVMGWVVSIPVFCDSGYVVLSPLQRSIARRTGKNPVVLGTALATGLYASHTFVPPTPGPIAAAGNVGIGSDGLVWVILFSIPVSLVAALAGLLWALRRTQDLRSSLPDVEESFEEYKEQFERLPGLGRALAPILVPIVLMATGSVAAFPSGDSTLVDGALGALLTDLGSPVNALLIGVVLALALLPPRRDAKALTTWVAEGLVDAAPILVITGAGGAFGAVIKGTPLADYIGTLIGDGSALKGVTALLVLFGIAALLKTAQGSSTAALIITSTLAQPLLPTLGLDGTLGSIPIGQVMAVMAIGAGAMVVSHVNDSYFWVVTQFSGMDVKTAYRAHTAATLVQGLSALAAVLVLGAVLL